MSEVKLFPHQVKALDAVKDYNRVLFALDMGLRQNLHINREVENL
jgi:hypothetical protein